MDIRMPYLNGMEAAHRLRTMDSKVLLIFITNLAQYAIKGYEVDALDYVLKPVSYYDFALKMTRAMNRLAPEEEKINIVLSTTDGKVRLPLDEILYIETSKHHLIYHTVSEKTYTQYATLSSVTEKFSHHHFARCNSCYLVNLKYVQKVKGYLVTINGVELQISQPRKKEFIQSLMEYTERTEL
jgi:DNA-binding LytR/AlgR family response regulator